MKESGKSNIIDSIIEYLKDYIGANATRVDIFPDMQKKDFYITPSENYLYYPYLFTGFFQAVKEEILIKFSAASFLYFKSVLYLDSFIDEEDENADGLFISDFFREMSLKILAELFSYKHPFWTKWNYRKKDYYESFKVEKRSLSGLADYENLCNLKSAMGMAAIDGLYYLSGSDDKVLYSRLLKSHAYAYTASQLLDDVMDFKEDAKSGNFNFALHSLFKELDEENKNDRSTTGIERLNKLLYIRGYADRLYSRAIDYLHLALEELEGLPLAKWTDILQKRLKSTLYRKIQISDYVHQTSMKVKLGLSNRKRIQGYSRNEENKYVHGALTAAADYLSKAQEEDGSWPDCTIDGILTPIWTTAFVLNFINKNDFNESTITKGIDFLKKKQQNHLWGINESWINDAHTSAWAASALCMHKISINSILASLKYHQKENGGFATYRSGSDLKFGGMAANTKGWTSVHNCLSALMLKLLSKFKEHHSAFNDVIGYFRSSWNNNHGYEAYWWTSPVMVTYLLFAHDDHDLSELFEHADDMIINIIRQQHNDGSFGDRFMRSSPFYTALIIMILSSNKDLRNKYFNTLKKSLIWLLSHQYEDGSWESSSVLRLPSPEVIQPQSVISWKIKPKGFNTRIKEEYRLLTTAVCYAAIRKYRTTFE